MELLVTIEDRSSRNHRVPGGSDYSWGRRGLSSPWRLGSRGCNLVLCTGNVTPFSRRTIMNFPANLASATTPGHQYPSHTQTGAVGLICFGSEASIELCLHTDGVRTRLAEYIMRCMRRSRKANRG